MARYIEHVTLDTGHARRSPRAEVDNDVVRMLAGWITRALAGESVPVADGTRLTAQARGKCLLAEIVDADLKPLATIGIGAHSRCGAPLWRELHTDARATATDPGRPPPEPWVAARLRPDVTTTEHPAVHWLGDFERCLAWAWLERK